MSGRLRMATVLACASCLAGPALAQAETALELDTHVPGSAESAGPISTPAPLAAGSHYDIIVSGTMSIWPASQWLAKGTVCGAAEEGPMFPSPGAENGPVGWDAETVFAVPPDVNFYAFSCVPAQMPFQSTEHSPGGFQIQVNGGSGFHHMAPIGGERKTPTATHTYTYAITGEGDPVAFRFVDDPVSDDYGVFKIKVLTAAECAAINCEEAASTSSDQTVPAGSTGVGSGGVLSSSVVHLPTQCHSRREFPVHFRVPRGVEVAKVVELINGRVVHSFSASVARHIVKAGVNLRGFPAGTFTLELRVTTTRGQVLRTIRTYHTCKKKKAAHKAAH